MKLLVTTTLLLCPLVGAAGTWKARRLPESFDFLISEASPEDSPLCIAASEGPFGNLKLLPCDFDSFPPEQLWNLQDGKFYNDLGNGNEKCMVVNHGHQGALEDGVRMRLADSCTKDSPSLDEFVYDGNYIRLLSDLSYCVTNRGATAHVGDTLHAKPCRNRDDFKWKYTEDDPRLERGELYVFYADGGCIQPKNGKTDKFTEIIIDHCDARRAWNVKQIGADFVLFQSRLDLNMCMQTGLGGYVDHGTKLRLMPCNEAEEYQQFDWSDETPIKLASRDDLCLEWRGRNVNVGVDPIIMKECDQTVYKGWSGDSVDD